MQEIDISKLRVLHEDNQIIVVEKPANIPSQGDKSGDLDMLSLVKEYIRVKYNKPGDAYVGLVHRLDRPTGGVMVFARTSKAAARLSAQMKEGEFDKKYLCVTCGEPKDKSNKLVNYLKKNSAQNKVMVVPMLTEGAVRAELDYTVLETIQDFSLVEIKIYTGRSHQIRTQMASIGHPLFGDAKYGANPKTLRKGFGLWATYLSFVHPTTNKKMTFISYPPTDKVPWRAYDLDKYLNIKVANDPYAALSVLENQD